MSIEIKDLKNENVSLKIEIKDLRNENVSLKTQVKELTTQVKVLTDRELSNQNRTLAAEFILSSKIARMTSKNVSDSTTYADLYSDNELIVKDLLTCERNAMAHGDGLKTQYTTDNPESLWAIIRDQLTYKMAHLSRSQQKKYGNCDKALIMASAEAMFNELLKFDRDNGYTQILD